MAMPSQRMNQATPALSQLITNYSTQFLLHLFGLKRVLEAVAAVKQAPAKEAKSRAHVAHVAVAAAKEEINMVLAVAVSQAHVRRA
jgi:hypothetical protein